MAVRPGKIIRTYDRWDTIRMGGRGGKRKIRRDTTLEKRIDGTLTFSYGDELLATLTPDDIYTFYKSGDRYYPAYSNIYRLIGNIAVYSDRSHFKHYRQPIRIATGMRRWVTNDNGAWERAKTMPFTNGLQYHNGECLNPEIAIDYKRTLNRAMSLPLLRKTEVLAKVLRVATRMQLLTREYGKQEPFEEVNIDDPTAEDAEIILNRGGARGLWGWQAQDPQKRHAALLRCAENGLAEYREWLYMKHDCYDMMPVETKGEEQ